MVDINIADPGDDEAALEDALFELRKFSGAMVSLTADESIANNTSTAIPWDQADYDTDSYWAAGNPTRLTAPANGRYRVTANVQWQSNATGFRLVVHLKNGAGFKGRGFIMTNATSTGNLRHNIVSAIVELSAGDYFENFVQQNSGGALTITAADTSWFSIERVS